MRCTQPSAAFLLFLLAACGTGESVSIYEPDTSAKSRRGLEAHCFYGETTRGRVPLSRIVHAFTTTQIGDRLDVSITFNRDFVDNSYGTTAVGWADSKKGRHSFKDLVGSDHTELVLLDAAGGVSFQAKLDYVSESSDAPSGYASLGPHGGDGDLVAGSADDVLAFDSSFDDNLNELGHVLLADSPETDAVYSPNADYPDWNFYVEYRLSVALSAFGDAGFGEAKMEMVHASPSKLGENTITVIEEGCPDPGGEDDPFTPCQDGTCLDAPGGGSDPGGEPKSPPSNDPDPGACSADADCSPGETCSAGSCIPSF